MKLNRRETLLAGLFGAEYIGLRALATGLPAWFIARPGEARAQDLQCAIEARDKMQYLVMSTSSSGDPLNCNAPGTYEAPEIIHPLQPTMAPTMISLAGRNVGAALPWASTDVGGALAAGTL